MAVRWVLLTSREGLDLEAPVLCFLRACPSARIETLFVRYGVFKPGVEFPAFTACFVNAMRWLTSSICVISPFSNR